MDPLNIDSDLLATIIDRGVRIAREWGWCVEFNMAIRQIFGVPTTSIVDSDGLNCWGLALDYDGRFRGVHSHLDVFGADRVNCVENFGSIEARRFTQHRVVIDEDGNEMQHFAAYITPDEHARLMEEWEAKWLPK